MHKTLAAAIAVSLLTLAPAPAAAQDWNGGYIGLFGGQASDPDDGDRVLFDTDLDGDFNDPVKTAGGVDAFTPGFCDGIAQGPTPADGCEGNDGGSEFGARAGYDWQSGAMVYGLLLEYGNSEVRDSVSAFSITPARYTLSREVDDLMALRGRVGFAFGADSANLLYVTAGFARADIDNSFSTSNAVNTFTDNGSSEASGSQFGVGYERRLGDNFSVGLEYLATSLDDDEYRVRSQGPAPATNPFILVNANGTDFRRSDDELEFESVRLTLNYRF